MLELAGNSVTELANIAGVKPPSVSDWLNGKTKTLKSAPAIRLAKHFKINILWITEGIGPMYDQVVNLGSQSLESTPQDYLVQHRTINARPTLQGRSRLIVETAFKSKEQERIDKIILLLQTTSTEGLAVVLDTAERMAKQYPLVKKTPVSSQ